VEAGGGGDPPKIYYDSQTALICLENTVNMWAGRLSDGAGGRDCDHAHAMDLKVHLDGARIFNAAAALGENVAQMTRKVDSVMFCLSKGLARRWVDGRGQQSIYREGAHLSQDVRRGMRQAGVIAAAGLIALEKSPVDCISIMKCEAPGGRHFGVSRTDHRSEESAVKHRDF